MERWLRRLIYLLAKHHSEGGMLTDEEAREFQRLLRELGKEYETPTMEDRDSRV
jgi:hypothetical protein